MELYSGDRRLNELGEGDFNEILDNDVFHTEANTTSGYGMDDDWFESLFEDPVLNDKMMSDASQPTKVNTEHSYSMDKDEPSSPLGLIRMDDYGKVSTDMDLEQYNSNTALDLTQKTSQPQIQIKPDPVHMVTTTHSTILRQPTIVLATSQAAPSAGESYLIPKVNIKVEPGDTFDQSSNSSMGYDNVSLPPTPPSSNTSDSEGSLSPQRSPPSSPIRHVSVRHPIRHITQPSQPLFTSPIPQSGVLILSEEEKRTLISEGYHIPGKLPLTKQEEKNLKKIRRKIKNKISAQESRRKKKEYLENLEKRVEQFTSENTDLRKKVDNLENNNRSLISQLHKLQALVGKASASTTQAGTCLMVMVLCFAIFVPYYSPSTLNIGYTNSNTNNVNSFFPAGAPASPMALKPSPNMGPSVNVIKAEVRVDDSYDTPSMRSRVLLSLKDEEAEYGPHTPLGYFRQFTKFFNVETCVTSLDTQDDDIIMMERAEPVTMTAEIPEPIRDLENHTEVLHATMHPDIAADVLPVISTEKQNNTA
ncbi:unnamed protein product [Owenia fusiformis]|uniref:Uncharacterized protein n=1 Tax=Owenia fusiformis TaxID=6347 RepID=A0A8J1TBC2_OWEFU|nr:unnamed protein product [Owenia fusiformis]